jgi:8-amino-7-oxononanoate synthase
MARPDWEADLERDLARRRDEHLFRRRQVVRPLDATHIEVDGRRYVNFASNNYLGLTHHPRVIEAASHSASALGAGSGAAPLITGYGPAHESAERRIATWKGTQAAVLLPSGYQANVAAVQALAAIAEHRGIQSEGGGDGVRFLLDKLVHASLVDAVRSTGSPYRIFPHNHLSKLQRLLAEADPGQLQVVVTESIFSMDGDAADLAGLADLKARRPFVLLLDEAHASGVYGEGGAGLAAERGLRDVADVTVVTLSKALGSAGGAVCASTAVCDAVINYGRAYIYSTHLPPAAAAAAEAAIDVIADEPHRQRRVRALAIRVRSELRAAGLTLPPGDSPIIPITLGTERAALEAARAMQDQGLWVLAIRPPTVPRGTSRLRVTLCSEHHDDEIAQLVAALASFH